MPKRKRRCRPNAGRIVSLIRVGGPDSERRVRTALGSTALLSEVVGMADAEKPFVCVNDTVLRDMVDSERFGSLLQAFGTVGGFGAGLFTPTGSRIGKPAHHSPFCDLVRSRTQGERACEDCDLAKIRAYIDGNHSALDPSPCHAGLVDFGVPIFQPRLEERHLIGIFLAGQVRYQDEPVSGAVIGSLRRKAVEFEVDSDELIAKYIEVPVCSRERVAEIWNWMRRFADLIGLLVDKKAAAERLLLDVINSGDNQHEIVRAVQRNFRHAAVSVFLKSDEPPRGFEDSIFLVATTFEGLARRLESDPDPEDISYRRSKDDGLTGWVYAQSLPLHISDVRVPSCYPKGPDTPRWKHKVKEVESVPDVKAFLGVPVRSITGDTIGVLRAVRTSNQSDFTEDETELLVGAARAVSAAVSTALVGRQLEAQGTLLHRLAHPSTTPGELADLMATTLGRAHVGPDKKWRAVYILQHRPLTREFRIVGVYPPGHSRDAESEDKGHLFADSDGVAGRVMGTGAPVVTHDLSVIGVTPEKGWRSVVAYPIVHDGHLWGVVALCGDDADETEVEAAQARVERFADQLGIICRISDTLDARAALTAAETKEASLHFVTHQLQRDLTGAVAKADWLGSLLTSVSPAAAEEVAGLRAMLFEKLQWLEVCRALRDFIRLCTEEAEVDAEHFWSPPSAAGSAYSPGLSRERVDVGDVARRVSECDDVRGREDRCHTRIQLSIAEGATTYGNENLLFQALQNLVCNAFEHGIACAGSLAAPSVALSVGFESAADEVCITVQDNGAGMDGDILSKTRAVYENPTSVRGFALWPGFGTMIVSLAAAVHSGTVSVTSEPAGGTKVELRLPAEGAM